VHKIAIIEVAFGGKTEEVIIELYPSSAPQTVANFVNLCESKFYDGLAFHRAIEGFLVQTGDPLTADEEKREQWGTGGEDRTLPAEIKRPHRLGTVAMARRNDSVNPSKRSNSSQFYFALGHYPFLDGNYSVFGQVVSGIDTIQYIARMPVDSNDCPIGRIELASVRVTDHRGPLVSKAIAGRRGYQSPGSKGFIGRFLSRVW
jgi:cyclophilin family peptidyl-prolyl cis-trans isomerase